MNSLSWRIGASAVVASLLVQGGRAGDVFNTESQVSRDPAAPLLAGAGDNPCGFGAVTTPLQMFEAIERTLCLSPKTRQAWAAVKSAAAGLGVAKGAYLPTLDGSATYGREHDVTRVDGPPDLGSDYSQNVNTESLQLGWVLYDFGGREAAVRNARQLLVSAQAIQNQTLQTAFATTAQDYYTAQAANAAVQSTRRIETAAQKSLEAAGARYKSGVSPVTDQLQANTAYAQAVYQRAAAEGTYRLALGALAVDMSLPPDHPLGLPDLDQGVLPDTQFVHAVHDLVDEATRTHPSVVAANAQYQAALALVSSAKAAGLPKIQFTGTFQRAGQPLNQTVGTLEYPSNSHTTTYGLAVTVPIFEGFTQTYKIRQAEAEAEQQEALLHDTEHQVATAVWAAFQTLETDTENLRNTDTILQSARQAFQASQQRYGQGVGNILELLTAQSTLAAAEQQRIQAQVDWRIARLQMAVNLGTLGMWAVK